MRNFVITVRMDQEFHARLKARAELECMSMNEYCLDRLGASMDADDEFEAYEKSQAVSAGTQEITT